MILFADLIHQLFQFSVNVILLVELVVRISLVGVSVTSIDDDVC